MTNDTPITATQSIEGESVSRVRHPPRQERSTKTLGKLENAARHVLATLGRDRFTTKDVAAQAGVSIGTFYRYFDDRVQLLDHIWPDRGDTHLEPGRNGASPAPASPTEDR